jgi:hypothetical protein
MYAHEVMSCQSCKSPNFKNFRTPNLGILRQNDIWVQVPWPSTKNNIRGKVVASPMSGLWWVLWNHVCSWLVGASKVFQLHTNQLVVWFVQVVWIIDPLVACPSPHPGAPTHPSTLEVLQTKECTATHYPSIIFTFGLTIESIKEFGGVSCDINFHCGRMELCVQPWIRLDFNVTSIKLFIVYNFHHVQLLICPHHIHYQNLWAT